MRYSERFDRELSDLEACAMDLADGENTADHELAARLDDLINGYPVDAEAVRRHADAVARIHRTRRDERTARKHIDTVHQAFLDEIYEDYDPVY